MNTFNLSLDLDKRAGVTQWVTLRQGDHNGTQLRATIYDHGTQAGGGYTCRVSIRLPGEGNEYYRETATYTNGVAVVTVDEEYAAAIVGVTEGYFELLQGDAVIASTESFGVRILRSAQDGAVPGDKYDSAIEDALAELDEATGRISQMVVDATEEYLEAHPELTTTVEDNSLTDAKLIQHGGILDRVARLWHRLDNLLTATPAESDSLTVTDAAKTPMAGLALYGRSTQDGTPTPDAPVAIESVEGNLLDTVRTGSMTDSGVTWTYHADGTITAVGTATANSWSHNSVNRILAHLTAGTYTASVSAPFGLVVYSGSTRLYSGGQHVYVFTLSAESDVSVYAMVPNGTTVNATTGIMLMQGNVRVPYVPYQNVGTWARGRNLLDIDSLWVELTAYGVTYTSLGNGEWAASGTADGSHDSQSITNANGLMSLPAGSYVFSGCPAGGGNSTYILTLRIQRANGTNAYVQDNGSGEAFTFADGDLVTRIYTNVKDGVNMNGKVFRPMISPASQDAGWMPYAESVTPIDLQGHTLRSLPDGTRDEVTVDQYGHATLIQRVFHVTLDGVTYKLNHNSGGYCSGSYSRMRTAPSSGAATWVQCDHFPRVVAAGGCYIANNMFVIRYGESFNPTSQAELDAWFQANPTTFQFALADAQISYYDLGTVDPVALQGPDMTAQSVPTAPFALTYERDLNVTLSRLEAAIAEVATS